MLKHICFLIKSAIRTFLKIYEKFTIYEKKLYYTVEGVRNKNSKISHDSITTAETIINPHKDGLTGN